MTKFTYENTSRSVDDAVAFIDEDDDLVIIDTEKCDENLTLTIHGTTLVYSDQSVAYKIQKSKHLFFPGDSVTITF